MDSIVNQSFFFSINQYCCSQVRISNQHNTTVERHSYSYKARDINKGFDFHYRYSNTRWTSYCKNSGGYITLETITLARITLGTTTMDDLMQNWFEEDWQSVVIISRGLWSCEILSQQWTDSHITSDKQQATSNIRRRNEFICGQFLFNMDKF